MDKTIIKWQAPEDNFEPKSPDWFWAVGIIAFSVAAAAVFMNNVLFAVLIVLSAFTIFMFAKRQPVIIEIEINESGIRSGKSYYPHASVKAFWVEEREKKPKLFLKTDRVTFPFVTILIEKINPERVRVALADKLVEEEMHEPLSQKIMEYLGF